MNFTAIQAILDTQLKTVVGLPTLQLENTQNVGITGKAFSRATLLPARSYQMNVGPGGTMQLLGLYQIDLFYPINTGVSTINAMVDAVIAAFPKGFLTDADGVVVQIDVSWRETGRRVEQFYSVPVAVSWTCIRPA